jgi:carboxypeptidase family protein/TonB-dependent receptor-like protein
VRRTVVTLAVFAACAVAAPSAYAQLESSHFAGVVTDAQGAVLPGVTVTATSPSLIGSQVALTEPNGTYRFPALPAGTYTLAFEIAGFQPQRRANVVLALGQTLTVDAQLQLQAVQETVTVTADAPVVDTQTTAVGSTLNAEKLIQVPTSTDLWGALARSPGVRMTGYDVGGSHKSEQRGYEAFGIRSQSRIVTEGVDTTEGTGGAGFYQDYYSQSEIAVSAAGGDVTMNTPGAAVMSTIKSGGNDFRGLYHLSYEPKRFVGDNVDAATSARGFTGTPNNKFWEIHPDVGGPIKRDKAWFYTAYNHFTIDVDISGVPHDRATYQGFYNNFTTKETYKASAKDTLIGYYQYGGLETPNRSLSAFTPPESAALQQSYTWMYDGKWDRVWSNRWFSEVVIGDFGYHFPQGPLPGVDFHTSPPRVDLATNLQSGAAWLSAGANGPFLIERNKPQIFVTSTYFLPTSTGSHDLKVGGEWLDDAQRNFNTGASGDILYEDFNSATNQVKLFDYGDPATLGRDWTGADNRNRRVALYAQDRWTISGRVTVTAGVRYDRQRPYYLDGTRKPLLADVFPAAATPGRTLIVRNNVAPRLGISWSPTHDGRSALKAFYGRYYFNLAQQLAAVNPGGANAREYRFNDLNGNRLYDGPQELGALVSTSGGTTTTLDDGIRVPYADEVNLSFTQQVWGEASIRAAYVRKMVRNDYSTFNLAREGQFIVATPVGVTLSDFDLSNPRGVAVGQQAFSLVDIPSSLRGVVRNTITNIPDSVGGGSDDYDTFELAFNKRFARRLFVDSSFDVARRNELRANSASTNPFNSDPLGIGYFQNVNPAVSNRQTSTHWQAHLSGRYEWPLAIGTGIDLQVQSGWPYARLVTTSLPNAGTQTFFLEDIGNNRSDTVPVLNLRVDKALPLSAHRLTLMLDLHNTLNSNAVTNFNLANGAQYNRIIATLQPRTAQIGARLEF